MAHVTVPQGHVGLVLLQNGNSTFYLEIPLNIINGLCLRPRKYLRFLGWCILGVEGVLALQAAGDGISDNAASERHPLRQKPSPRLQFVHAVGVIIRRTEFYHTRDHLSKWSNGKGGCRNSSV